MIMQWPPAESAAARLVIDAVSEDVSAYIAVATDHWPKYGMCGEQSLCVLQAHFEKLVLQRADAESDQRCRHAQHSGDGQQPNPQRTLS